MLVSVTFYVGMLDAWMLWALREERFREKKATVPLYLLLQCLRRFVVWSFLGLVRGNLDYSCEFVGVLFCFFD